MDYSRDVAIVDRTIYKNSSLTLAPDSGLGGSLPVTDNSNELSQSGSRCLSELSTISGVVPVVGEFLNQKVLFDSKFFYFQTRQVLWMSPFSL